MPTYILLANWTDQGIRSFAGTVDRSEAAAKAFEAVGGRLKDIYWTMGPYDFVALVEAPDEQAASAISLGTAAQGNIRGITMRAFDAKEMRSIVARASGGGSEGEPHMGASGGVGEPHYQADES